MTYYNLLDAWWDRIPGLHVVDFGVDLDLDGEVWTLSCWGIGEETDWVLNVAPRSVRTQLSTEPETVDASTLQPWASVIGAPIQRQEARGRCVLRL